MSGMSIKPSKLSRRIVVDPNSFARRDPKLSVVIFDAQELPEVHEVVWAVQPDDDGEEEGVAPGIVRVVDHRYRLAYIEVDWSLFVTQPVVQHNHNSRGVHLNCPACGTMVSDLRARLLEVLRTDDQLTPEQAEGLAQDLSAWAEQQARDIRAEKGYDQVHEPEPPEAAG